MPNFKKKQTKNKPILTLIDPYLFSIIEKIIDNDCDFHFEVENNTVTFSTEYLYDALEECIDPEYPNEFTEKEIKHILVTLKMIEHKGFTSLFLEK